MKKQFLKMSGVQIACNSKSSLHFTNCKNWKKTDEHMTLWNLFFAMMLVVLVVSSFYLTENEWSIAIIVITGNFKLTGPNTGICKGKKNQCGFRDGGPVPSSEFIFPETYQGPFPAGTYTDGAGRLVCATDYIINLNDPNDGDCCMTPENLGISEKAIEALTINTLAIFTTPAP